MVKLALALMLLSTTGYAASKWICPALIPIYSEYGIVEFISPKSEFALQAKKNCESGKVGINIPCVYELHILSPERVQVFCGPLQPADKI